MSKASIIEVAAALETLRERKKFVEAQIADHERALIALTGFCKAEGSERFPQQDELGSCDIVCEQPIYTKIDATAWRKLRAKLPAKHPARDIFRQKFELDLRKARAFQASDQAGWNQISSVVTRTPGKIAVRIEKLQLKE